MSTEERVHNLLGQLSMAIEMVEDGIQRVKNRELKKRFAALKDVAQELREQLRIATVIGPPRPTVADQNPDSPENKAALDQFFEELAKVEKPNEGEVS